MILLNQRKNRLTAHKKKQKSLPAGFSSLFRPISFFLTKTGMTLLLMLALMFGTVLRWLMREAAQTTEQPGMNQTVIEEQQAQWMLDQCKGFTILEGTLARLGELRIIVFTYIHNRTHLLDCLTAYAKQMYHVAFLSSLLNAGDLLLNPTPQVGFSGFSESDREIFNQICRDKMKELNIDCIDLSARFALLKEWYKYCEAFKEQMAWSWVYRLVDMMRGTWNSSVQDQHLKWANKSISELWSLYSPSHASRHALGPKRFAVEHDPAISGPLVKKLKEIFFHQFSNPSFLPGFWGEIEKCLQVIGMVLLLREDRIPYSHIFHQAFLNANHQSEVLWGALPATNAHHLYAVLLPETGEDVWENFRRGILNLQDWRHFKLVEYVGEALRQYQWLILILSHPARGEEVECLSLANETVEVSDFTVLRKMFQGSDVNNRTFVMWGGQEQKPAEEKKDPGLYAHRFALSKDGQPVAAPEEGSAISAEHFSH